METSRLLECLADDYTRLRDIAAKDLAAAVPSCPGWTVTDLVSHVSAVYLHKAEAMRQQQLPRPWPPDLSAEEPIALLDRAYTDLAGEFASRAPDDPAWTWHAPDQAVRFWIRRMAQETVIHRIDAELALGDAIAPIPADLAVDGIDEVLHLFLDYGSRTWREDFEGSLDDWGGRSVLISTDGARWRVTVRPDGVAVSSDDGAGGEPGVQGIEPGVQGIEPGVQGTDASVRGRPVPLLLWLWNRGGEDAVVSGGDPALVDHLRRLLVIATQ
jgi:uncharacterized protein (TIGR03083 family)